MLNLDQRRAYHAYNCVSEVTNLKEYKVLVNGLGPNIIRSGLVAALAFLQRYRSPDVKKQFAQHIASGLPQEWKVPNELDEFVAHVRKVDNMQYMLITREIMRLTLWFKRAVQASDQSPSDQSPADARRQ
jgi:CRISPR-associated protein Cmr5